MDYNDLKEAQILFVSDSLKVGDFGPEAFSNDDYDLILDVFKSTKLHNLLDRVQYTASVKCPKIRADDMTKEDRDICRNHLDQTLLKVKPKLIFACGNLPLLMLTKRTGVESKRGRAIQMEGSWGNYIVVPIYHPFQVLSEPKNRYLFQIDIENAINEFILNKNSSDRFTYSLLDTLDRLHSIKIPSSKSSVIAIDTETTGLNFLKDKILTIALSFKEGEVIRNYVIPLHHKESRFNDAEKDQVIKFMGSIMVSKARKVLHNAKFDLKFFSMAGIKEYNNIWDTKIMQHLVDENLPKSLKDLVNYYFPHEIES
jgi:uracil-DNA glycosylase family 4